jgi:hypothetical protein
VYTLSTREKLFAKKANKKCLVNFYLSVSFVEQEEENTNRRKGGVKGGAS